MALVLTCGKANFCHEGFQWGPYVLFTSWYRNVQEGSKSIKAPFSWEEKHFTAISTFALGHHSTQHSVGGSSHGSLEGWESWFALPRPQDSHSSNLPFPGFCPGWQLSFKASFFLFLFFYFPFIFYAPQLCCLLGTTYSDPIFSQ